jgi:chromosomal replication initiator protein
VAESPGAVYNPLFVYAGSGLGKTHLLMAIGHAAQEINPQVTVEYLTLDDFVEAFHTAIAAGQGDAYRRRYAEVGVLLVDDVQFLTHRREMQAELLRLTNTMLSSGRQIVLSSDRPPNEIEALDERPDPAFRRRARDRHLRTRFRNPGRHSSEAGGRAQGAG